MKTKIIDGKSIAEGILNKLKAKLAATSQIPTLAIILIGQNPASLIYVGNKIKQAAAIGAKSSLIKFDEDICESQLLDRIDQLNKDSKISGIIVQLPLPKHINLSKVIQSIEPSKDIDGFNPLNVGILQTRQIANNNTISKSFIPCTALACMSAIKSAVGDLTGKHVVIVNRSNLVGKPLANLLLEENSTITICHSFSKQLSTITKLGDIVICAIGKAKFFNRNYFKPGAVVIDVGISRTNEGIISGDVDFDDLLGHASHITPVPGGIGPLTVAHLLSNLVSSLNFKLEK